MSVIVLPSCRWCHEPVELENGRFVGPDRQASCYLNTAGCGPVCGFFCRCEGHDWSYGNHEPMEAAG